MSQQSTDLLSKQFVEVDRKLPYGFSRYLMAQALGFSESETKNFMAESKYDLSSEQYASSLSMKAFLQIMEDRVKSEKEISYVNSVVQKIEQLAADKEFHQA